MVIYEMMASHTLELFRIVRVKRSMSWSYVAVLITIGGIYVLGCLCIQQTTTYASSLNVNGPLLRADDVKFLRDNRYNSGGIEHSDYGSQNIR